MPVLSLTTSFLTLPSFLHRKSFILLCALVGLTFCLKGQAHPEALPAIVNYSPSQYQAGAQNWAVVQDQRGIMYFGNNKGLLEYDGVRWELITLPDKSAVRSLAIDEEGTIWVGGQGLFGSLTTNKKGKLSIKFLSDSLPKESQSFDGVPNIHITPQGTIFHSFKRLFIYQQGKLSSIAPKTLFQPSFYVRDKVYLNEERIGLQYLYRGALVLMEGGEFFADKRVELIFPYKEGSLLIGTEKHGTYVIDTEGKVSPLSLIPETSLPSGAIFGGIKLPNGQYALGTHQNGILLLDSLFRPLQVINEDKGLRNNLVWSMGVDKKGDLWLGLDDGLANVHINSPFQHFATEGSVLASRIYQEQLYIGTTQGVFSTSWGEYQSPFDVYTEFRSIKGTEEQAWQLFPTEDELICGHIKGLYSIQNGQSNKIWEGFSWGVTALPDTKDHLIAGTHNQSLLLLKHNSKGWEIDKEIEGFNESARYLAVGPKHSLWVSHPLKGVFRLQMSEDWKEIVENRSFTMADGLPADTYNYAFSLPNIGLVFGTEKGLYVFNEQTQRFEEDARFIHLPKVRKLVEDAQGRVWFWANERSGWLYKNENNLYEPAYGALQKLNGTDLYSIYPNGQYAFFGTPNGLIRYDIEAGKQFDAPSLKSYAAMVRKVTSSANDSTLFHGAFVGKAGEIVYNQSKDQQFAIPYTLKDLQFTCAATWFEDSEKLVFQYYLEGFDENPTAWTSNAEKAYTNLPAGDYTFYVKARNSYGLLSSESSFTFTILTPWHQTWFAYCLYVAGFIGLLWIGVTWYTRRLESDKRRLERIVKDRTEEVVTQKEAIECQNVVLAEQKEELEALNDEKSHLIGILAHDMRNPLHQIKGSVDIIKMKNSAMVEEDAKFLRVIENAVAHLNGMIGKILDLEAIESKKTNIQLEPIDLGNTAKVVIDSVQYKAAEKNIQLVADIEDRAYPCWLDRNFSIQVLDNLVSNALKFSEPNTSIHISVYQSGDAHICASVRDEGPGISSEDMTKLFGKFQKLSARPTAGEKSTGLGLSIVKKYVEAMNGKVWCESEPGKGAKFIIEFPIINPQENVG